MIVGLMNCLTNCLGSLFAKNRTTTTKRLIWRRVFSPRREITNSRKNGFLADPKNHFVILFFLFVLKMNPETISIPDCTLDNPVKKSSGKISFCLLPCLHNGERLQVKLPTRFKIYSHPGNGNGNDSFSLGISIPENSLEFFRDLEKHLNALAMKKTKEVEKIGRSFARYDQGDFSLLKVDKSEQEKIYAKIYPSKLPNQDFSCRFWQLCGAKKKKPIPHPTKLINMPLRGQVVFSVKHLFCGNVKTITCIVDEVLVEEVVQSVSAFDDFEDRDESDLESDEDF